MTQNKLDFVLPCPHIIADPIYKIMDFGNSKEKKDNAKKIIDTKEFQRLRRISQLGMASFVFPGATHSRFAHSLGASYLSLKVLDQLESCETKNEIQANRDLIYYSALLHDIGHGPFSHSFEKAIKGLADDRDTISHEIWTSAIIKETQLSERLNEIGLEPSTISDIILKKNDTIPRYLSQVVSSQIDVDRMDYLMRDAHFSGLHIGTFDVDYLIKNLVFINPYNNNCTSQHKTLGISYKGLKPYESFLFSRHQMNRSLYFHPKIKTLEFMIERFIKLVVTEVETLSKNRKIPPFLLDLNEYYINKSSDSVEEFTKKTIRNYLNLTEDKIWWLLDDIAENPEGSLDEINILANKILTRQPYPYFESQISAEESIQKILKDKGINNDVEKVAIKSTLYNEDSKESVFCLEKDGKSVIDVNKKSTSISSLSGKMYQRNIFVLTNEDKKSEFKAVIDSLKTTLLW